MTENSRIRDINSRLNVLDKEKFGLVYDWMERNGHGPKGDKSWTWPWETAEKATAGRKKEINAEMRALREERKVIEAANKVQRVKTQAENKERKQAARDSVTAECQICENRQCMTRDGRMVHHGYQRPGDGYIHGDCMGVGYLPFPAYDALEAYLPTLQRRIAFLVKSIKGIPKVTTYTRKVYNYKSMRDELQTVTKNEVDERTWEKYMASFRASLDSELRWYRSEAKGVEARIEKAKGEK